MSEILHQVPYLDGPRDKDRIRADEWQRDERMEHLAKLRDSRPEIFERLDTTARISLGYYENDKQAAARHGRDTSKGR
ncbi:hypothetical protein [Kitasatospora griseola]|uniref:hypothetical protein n=1 Tax=Kitasatospora griseola TaxID=2064 RepID=UPI0036572163